MEDNSNYPPLEDVLQHVSNRLLHHLWTACRFMRDNPGC